jgi:UDP-N-acetylmuramoyl-tripeptide--D-alanyl-D-alanine ligase
VLLADDEKVASLKVQIVGGKARNAITYGMALGANICGGNVAFNYSSGSDGALTGTHFDLTLNGKSWTIDINGVLGNTYVYPLLAAAAVGKARGMSDPDILKGLNEYEAPHGRMNIVAGLNGSTIIDDTYNSSPDAAMSALEALAQVQCVNSGRKIVVFGDMLELGKYAADEHRRVGARVAEVADVLVTVGQRSRMSMVEGAMGGDTAGGMKEGMKAEFVHSFDSSEEAGKYVASFVGAGDVVLVKGSQSTRMERVSAALLREPARVGELLVRQEKEWLEKK